MSVSAVRWAFSQRDLSPTLKIVLVCVSEHAHRDTLLAWPSNTLVAVECGLTRQTVNEAIKALEAARLIERVGKVQQVVQWRFDLSATPTPPVGHADTTCRPRRHDLSATPTRNPQGTTSEPPGNHQPPAEQPTLALVEPLPDTSGVDEFTQWWALYPRKTAKAEARKAWTTALKRPGITGPFLLAAVRTYPFDEREGGRFIPYPTTWLRGSRWEDQARRPSQAFIGANTDHWANGGGFYEEGR